MTFLPKPIKNTNIVPIKSFKLQDEDGNAYGVKEVDNKPTISTDADIVEGNQAKIMVQDANTEGLLNKTLKELKKVNLHLGLMTDEDIENSDII